MLASIRRHPAGNAVLVLVIAQVLAIGASLLYPDSFRYASAINVSVLLDSMPVLGIIAVGVGLLMIAGEFDLSVGSVLVFCSIVMGDLYVLGASPWLAAAAAIAIGVAIGVFHGTLTLWLSLPSFIVTLGGMLFWRGMALFVHGSTQIPFSPGQGFQEIFGGRIWLVPTAFIWFVVVAIVFNIILQHTRFGNHIFAVGGNRASAAAIGIRVNRVKIAAFAISSGLAAFAGIISSTRLGAISMTQGASYELEAIAAGVIGGVALTGGRGSIIAVFIGVILINTIRDVLLLAGAPGFYLGIFVGALIVTAAALNERFRIRS